MCSHTYGHHDILRVTTFSLLHRAELRQIESQLSEALAKVASLQKRKDGNDAAAKRVGGHLESALGQLTGVRFERSRD